MVRDLVGPFFLTVAQFLVAIAVFVGVGELVGGSGNGDLVIVLSVVFAVTAVTWGYWQVTGGGWGISYREYLRRKEEGDAEPASGPGYGPAREPTQDRDRADGPGSVDHADQESDEGSDDDRSGGTGKSDGDGGSGAPGKPDDDPPGDPGN